MLVARCVAQAEHDLTRHFATRRITGHRPRFGDTVIEDQAVIDVRKTASRLCDRSGQSPDALFCSRKQEITLVTLVLLLGAYTLVDGTLT